MKIEDCIGRFNIRKTLRFEMKPVGKTADFLAGHLEADEERAASLNKVKAAIEAEHLMMVRRVFKSLPDPIPAKYDLIRQAFRNDPEFAALSSRDARVVMQTILKRCRANGWAIPKELTDHDGWPTLTVKWHWYCFSKYDPSAAASLARKWTGRTKADVEKTCPLLRAPKKRKPSRNYWFDHSPFRVMFGNRTVGMNWTMEDFNASRTFLLTDSERIIIGITPRESKFSPYGLPDAANTEASYSLYEEAEAQHPRMRAVPKELIDFPASRGAVYLFELSGRALRSRTNMNALYLRALLSSANLNDPTFRLRRGCEFFVRKGADIPADGKPDHFRQRFNEDKFFVSLPVSLNSQMAAINQRETAYGDLSKFIADNPTAKFILVGEDGTQVANATRDKRPFSDPATTVASLPTPESKNGQLASDGRDEPSTESSCGVGATDDENSTRAVVAAPIRSKLCVSRSDLRSNPSLLAGELAKQAVEEDAYIIFDPKTPKSVLEAVERKFNYIVIRGRDPLAVGGVLRGYQIPNRLFVGDLDAAKKAAAENRALFEAKQKEKEAEERFRIEKAAKKAAAREQAETDLRAAQERRRKMEELVSSSKPIALLDPIFAQGRYTFRFTYKTSDNVRHEDTCKADERDEVFQKLRTVKIRPMNVWCDDPTYEAEHARAIQSPIPNPQSPIAERLKRLDALKDQGLITESEYADKRGKILAEL